jgi:putative transposase
LRNSPERGRKGGEPKRPEFKEGPMARPLRIQYPGAYYHVTCRGNERREIFVDATDQQIYLERLSTSLETYNVVLLAYVCMTNHFHVLVSTPEGNLAEFMRHFNISYTSAFNNRHNRVGHLYQGRYKSFLIDADSYLLEVSRYIHLNPVRIAASGRISVEKKWDVLR